MKIIISCLAEVAGNIDFINRNDINLISIRDFGHNDLYDVIDNAGLKNLLVVQFDDLLEDLPPQYNRQEHPPRESDIAAILEWAKKKMSENSNDFIVQCTAGISRSSAVAILVSYLRDPSNALKVINPMFHSPNEKVLEIGEKLLNTKDIKAPTEKLVKDYNEKWLEEKDK